MVYETTTQLEPVQKKMNVEKVDFEAFAQNNLTNQHGRANLSV